MEGTEWWVRVRAGAKVGVASGSLLEGGPEGGRGPSCSASKTSDSITPLSCCRVATLVHASDVLVVQVVCFRDS